MDAFFRDIDLVFADRAPRCKHLTVEICQADSVVVDQIERADPAACECFHNAAADAADSENSHPAAGDDFHGFGA